MSGNLVDAMVNMKEKEALAIAKELVESGEDPQKVLGLCKEALEMVGKRFEEGTYFLPELVLAGEMMRQISDMVNPKLRTATQSEPCWMSVGSMSLISESMSLRKNSWRQLKSFSPKW